jgi:hypothetical protein
MAMFIGGIFLGFIFGFLIMALLTMASRPSGTKRHRQSEVVLFSPAPLPASLGLRRLRRRTSQRYAELCYPWALKR